jgi:hypothetical protein
MKNMSVDICRRRLTATGLGVLFISACEAKPMTVNLDVVLFSYLDRPIFDVYLNRTDIGVAGPWPYSGRGAMSGVRIPLGHQTISWRLDGPKGTPRNGETVVAKNLTDLQIVPSKSVFLGVHIYADDTVELIPSEHFPDVSDRGQEFDKKWKQNHGQ